jgi:hypothetical protein
MMKYGASVVKQTVAKVSTIISVCRIADGDREHRQFRTNTVTIVGGSIILLIVQIDALFMRDVDAKPPIDRLQKMRSNKISTFDLNWLGLRIPSSSWARISCPNSVIGIRNTMLSHGLRETGLCVGVCAARVDW